MVMPRRAPIEEAEHREAHNTCSRHSYAKNRLSINQRRRDTYHQQKTHPSKVNRPLEPLIQKAVRLVDIEVNSGHSHTQYVIPRFCTYSPSQVGRQSSELAEAMDQVEWLSAWFRIITSRSPKWHACIIYKEYAWTMTEDHPKGCRSLIDNAVLEISSLEQSLQEYENVILNYAGIGKEMKQYRLVWEPIQRLVCWLEEMLCEAMISPEGLREKYDRCELAFRALNQD
ncbi:hypothetical protein ARMGADRAFT_1029952 [Armillaria gallica]|uniref:Uncharacterized protein n=1 Tax=Armillaria gallica TaxID=47427 RepID=A0A2H3E0R2_ARMGA|nr:hypothetical protein ARMGADRAFT_1029952 [Armillaria gallica]